MDNSGSSAARVQRQLYSCKLAPIPDVRGTGVEGLGRPWKSWLSLTEPPRVRMGSFQNPLVMAVCVLQVERDSRKDRLVSSDNVSG